MFAVIGELEGDVEFAFVTNDRHEAHRVLANAQTLDERATVGVADPIRWTLIDCKDEADFYAAIIEWLPDRPTNEQEAH